MKYLHNRFALGTVAAAVALALPLRVSADAAYDALKSQVEALQEQLEQVQQTLKQYQENSTSKQEVADIKEKVAEVSATTSEWKNAESVVHLAGYGDATYSDSQHQNGAFSGIRFNPIFHYQYKDLVMLEAELEVEVEDDGGTSTNLEYSTLDLFVNDYLALIAGKFQSPVGYFRQNLHPSWINKLPTAPSGFDHDQAAPVSDVGLEARGGFPIGSAPRYVNYGVYMANGPVLEIDGNEIEAIEAVGRTSNDDGKFVFGGRVGFLPIPMLEIGLSGATGKVAGADESYATRDYDVYGADFAYKWRSLGLRSEYIKQKVGAEASSAAPESGNWEAWYAQAAYRFSTTKWESVLRYSDYDSPHDSDDQKQWAVGLNYLYSANAMAKLAYDFNNGKNGSAAGDDGFQVQFAYGF